MLRDAVAFWEAISGKVKQLVKRETKNAFRTERYEVTTAPNGTKIGVTLPLGSKEIFLPYSSEVASATVGDSVLVVWWGSMSNAKVYYFANGYDGSLGARPKVGTVSLPLSWNSSGSGYYTETPTVSGVTVTARSKIDLQATASQIVTLKSLGVTSMFIENHHGTLTAYSVGAAPTSAMTLQCTVTEVAQ